LLMKASLSNRISVCSLMTRANDPNFSLSASLKIAHECKFSVI
jgi:hypothetical protein